MTAASSGISRSTRSRLTAFIDAGWSRPRYRTRCAWFIRTSAAQTSDARQHRPAPKSTWPGRGRCRRPGRACRVTRTSPRLLTFGPTSALPAQPDAAHAPPHGGLGLEPQHVGQLGGQEFAVGAQDGRRRRSRCSPRRSSPSDRRAHHRRGRQPSPECAVVAVAPRLRAPARGRATTARRRDSRSRPTRAHLRRRPRRA